MASGTLGTAALAASTNTTVYTVPAGTVASINISLVNRGSTEAAVRFSIGATTPTTDEYVEYDAIVPVGGILERTAIVAGAGDNVVVRASTADCSVRVHGFEEVV